MVFTALWNGSFGIGSTVPLTSELVLDVPCVGYCPESNRATTLLPV
jgi:hypothetical protein